jgi:NAD(P)-dependent dehydrogenase (short-subunit alcohol dehydrogenase family)
MPNAIITGASSGLGRALARALADRGYSLTVDARRPEPLEIARRAMVATGLGQVTALVGDVTDADHRTALIEIAAAYGPIDLLVNNASELGGSPQPPLRDLTDDVSERLWRTNVDAPRQLIRAAWPHLADGAVIVNISSDAAVEHYEGWGGYGATKAALDHLTLTWAAEEPGLRWYSADPGDMRTPMHQAAFPGEDISDRQRPEEVAPRLISLITSGRPSGRYRAADFEPATPATALAEVTA